MDKGVPPTLFTNDGSFMERFKQLQQEQDKQEKSITLGGSKQKTIVSRSMTPNSASNKMSGERKTGQSASGGKLAFSLKQKSKLVVSAVKLGEDEDEVETDTGNVLVDAPTKRQKVDQPIVSGQSFRQVDVASALPSDPAVRKVAEKLASFVAKNGRQFEDVTRQKNPGETLFKFLFDVSCADYKYYEYRLAEEEKALSGMRDSQSSYNGGTSASASKPASGSQRFFQQQPNYQIPASALYDTAEDTRGFRGSIQGSSSVGKAGGSTAPTSADPIAMMEYYMKKAAHEERRRQPKQSKDEMPPPDSLQGPGKKGHHMGDYIPQEELEKFLASCNDVAAQKAAQEAAQRAKIQADNVGHKLLSKMGWKEGEGLGSSRSGIADPVMAGNVKKDNLGVGASAPGEVTPEDDIYEQYKKRMMLGYKHRPNPLGNPRKAYY